MEVLKLSRVELENRYGFEQTLASIITKLESATESEGKVICKISVNGLDLNEKDENRFGLIPVQDIHDLVIQVEEKCVIVDDTINSLREHLKPLQANCVAVAEIIRSQGRAEAQGQLNQIFNAAQWVSEALFALRPNWGRLQTDLNLLRKWDEAEGHMKMAVQELRQAFENQDFVLVGDVLEYELYSAMGDWLDLLSGES